MFSRLYEGLAKRLRHALKPRYQKAFCDHDSRRTVLILGFQRSGTTMLTYVFDRDWRVHDYGENELAIRQTDVARLIPVAEVREHIEKAPEQVSVIKPLVESQFTPELLKNLPRSRAVWLFRHFRASAASNVKEFADYNSDKLYRLLQESRDTHWVNEGLTPDIQEVIRGFAAKTLSDYDKMALVWFARNSLYFTQNLESRDDVMLIKYEDLVTVPGPMLERIYEFIGVDYPGDRITRIIHGGSLSKGAEMEYDPDVQALCEGLESRMDALRVAPPAD